MTHDSPKRVLVVDNSDDYCEFLIGFMSKAFPDAEVTTYDPVAKGAPGSEFDWSEFDVLIMEYRLGPEENGLDWLQRFKHDHTRFPATILLTASGNEDIAVRALRYGAHDYLRKQNLSTERLAESIDDAFNVRTKQSSSTQSLTLNASRFSKSFFYGQFSLAFEEAEKGENRAVILITIDGFDTLRDSFGVIGTDAIARHLGELSLDVFQIDGYRPRATRYTDSSIGLLAGQYRSKDDLERLLKGLCARLRNAPPDVDGTPVRITLSISAVIINSRAPGVAGLLQQAEAASAESSAIDGNSIVVKVANAPEEKVSETSVRAQVFDADEAIRENRLQAVFQALMRVSERSSKLPFTELFQISSRFIAHNGEKITADSVITGKQDDSLARLIDRWKIRECISRLLSGNFPAAQTPGFSIQLSEASCTDIKLATWVDKLIKHHGKRNRFGEICLSLRGDVFMHQLKPLLELMAQLNRQHGFQFGLSGIEDAEFCNICFSQFPFSLLIVDYAVLKRLKENKSGAGAWEKMLGSANNRAASTVVSGIEDAAALTFAISAGVDFVQGNFIAPEQEKIEAVVGVESVQIDS